MLERISIDNAISDFNNEDGLFYESENSDISDCDGDDTLKVVFAINVGKSHEGENIYQFFFSKDTEETFAEGWSMKPACNEHIGHLMIAKEMYEEILEFKTDVKLDLAQESCCFSMQDCRDNIIALAYENLDDASVYPEPYRIVIHFGDTKNQVIQTLIDRNIQFIEYPNFANQESEPTEE